MEGEYKKENKIIEKSDKEKEADLIVSIMKAKKEMDEMCKNFEFAEEDLIDYYTYQIKANRAKFDYLLKQAKHQGVELDMIRQIEIKLNSAI